MNEEIQRQFKEAEDRVRGYDGYSGIQFAEPEEIRAGCWIAKGSGSADGMPTRIVWSQETGCHEVHGGICQKWLDEGGPEGRLGLPTSDEDDYADDGLNARMSQFQNGMICGLPKDADDGGWDISVKGVHEPQVRRMLDFVDSEIGCLNNLLDSGSKQVDPSDREMVNAENCLRFALKTCKQKRRAFDSETFFIVIFGSVKAGKSTLVNAFVGKEEVSPTGQSVETTMRSSVILPAKPDRKEGIYIYHPTQDNDKSSDERCRDLIDFLGGLTSENEFLKEYSLKEFPLRKDNVDRFLALKEGDDPEFPSMLPPVLRIDVSKADERINILMDDVAVMDTPGLDGSTVDANRDAFWRILPEKGDLFLLVQSSMSAINNQCFERIKEIHSKTNNVPMMIVYNKIAARSWKRDEIEEEQLRKAAQAAAEDLGRKFKDFLHRDPPPQYQVNAGEAFDVVSAKEEDLKLDYQGDGKKKLLVESRIDQLKKEIRDTLKNHRYRYKIEMARSRMENDVNEQVGAVSKEIEVLSNSLKNNREQFNARKRKAEENCAKFANAFSGTGVGKKLAEEAGDGFQKLFEQDVDAFIASFEKTADKDCHFDESNKHVSREKAERRLRDFLEKINRGFVAKLKKHFPGPRLCLQLDRWEEVLKSNEDGLTNMLEWQFAAEGREAPSDKDGVNGKIYQDFCNSLFSTVKQDEIKDVVAFSINDFEIPGLPTAIQRWYFATDKIPDPVRSCEALSCRNELIDQMKEWFTNDAPKKAKELIERTIVKRGDDLGIELNQETTALFKSEETGLTNREAKVRSIIESLEGAKRHLSSIVQALGNTNRGE